MKQKNILALINLAASENLKHDALKKYKGFFRRL